MGETTGPVDEAADRRREFGEALTQALDGRPMGWLGSEIARMVGKPTPITPSAVSQWIAGQTEPERRYVFAAELILGLPGGVLSRILGYLPAGATPNTSVLEALDADPKLTKKTRAIVRSAYLSAIGE